MSSLGHKRIFTLFGFLGSLVNALLRTPRLLLALIRPATSRSLREEVMLACTSVNECRYCDWVHTRLALKNGVDVGALNTFLGKHDEKLLPYSDAVAVTFAQHFAESKTRASVEAKVTLRDVFGFWQRAEIMAYLYAIYFANLCGNTFDAFLSRLHGTPIQGSSVFTEVAVAMIGFPILVPILLNAGKDRAPEFVKSQA